MAPVKFYNDILSQPVRALWLFLKANNIPFDDCKVSLFKGEHKTEAYLKKFPSGIVPALEDDGFLLTESVAIFQYLYAKYQDKVADHWYPRDLRKRARVNEYLNWQHTGLRKHGVGYFVTKFIQPKMSNKPADAAKVAECAAELSKTLDFVEQNFLGKTTFVAGDDITVADLFCICEVMQPVAGDYDVTQGRPKLKAWMDRVKGRLGPLFDEAHQPILDITKTK